MRNRGWLFLFVTALAAVAYTIWRKEDAMDKETSESILEPTLELTTETLVPTVVTLQVAGDTDAGKKRPNNEDSFFVEESNGVFGIFDGMGGMAAGEDASRIAKETIQAFFLEKQFHPHASIDAGTVESLFFDSFCAADTAIKEFAAARGIHRIGTTAVAAVHSNGALYLANLGDSRGYLLRPGEKIKRLTQDHTIAAVLVEIGEITEEEARDPGARNRLLASLGDMGQTKPFYSKVAPLLPGDRIVLCSDGLWDMVMDAEVASITEKATTPEGAVEELIEAANKAGGTDNISVIVLFA